MMNMLTSVASWLPHCAGSAEAYVFNTFKYLFPYDVCGQETGSKYDKDGGKKTKAGDMPLKVPEPERLHEAVNYGKEPCYSQICDNDRPRHKNSGYKVVSDALIHIDHYTMILTTF